MRLLRTIPLLAALTAPLHADLRIKVKESFPNGKEMISTEYYKGRQYRIELEGQPGYQIVDLANNRFIVVDTEKREYSLIGGVYRGLVSGIDWSRSIHVNVTYRDRGEQRQMFGHTARHVTTTQERTEYVNGQQTSNSQELTTDGWYLDMPFDYPYRGGSPGAVYSLAFTTDQPGHTRRPDFKLTRNGTAPHGLTVWRKIGNNIREVTELSEAPLDQSLFEPPPDFRRVINPAPGQQLSWTDQMLYYWQQFEDWLKDLV